MAVGRPRKSAEEHKMLGTYQKCRHEGTGIKFDPVKDMVLPDSITDKKTVETWNTIVPSLCEKGLVSIVEVPILEYAFQCFQNAQKCKEAIEEQGGVIIYLTELDYKAKDLTKYLKDFMKDFNDIMFKFGITPAENPRVRSQVKQDPNDVSDLMSMRGKL